jgi:formate hydrogenlyase subunit 6/NADH:ubiquinone oxidoreductase subunit I
MRKQSPVIFSINWNACIKCGVCVAVCPLEESFISAFDTIAIDLPCSIACLACEEICPVTAIGHRLKITVENEIAGI